jgi:hypothetical protein
MNLNLKIKTMKKKLICLFFSLFVTFAVFAQTKANPAAKPIQYELQKILTGIDLPYKIVNDSLAAIPYEGNNIKSYQVIIQKISDLYIVMTDLTEILPGKFDSTHYKYLLLQNNNFDIVKIGMSAEDNNVYLRADLYKAGTNTALLKRVIQQVANVTDIIGGDLK